MAAISVYGYTPETLLTPNLLPEQQPKSMSQDVDAHILKAGSTACPLLGVPLELRQQIFSYVLPSTFSDASKECVWLRGNLAINSTNKQIHDECIQIMYGRCTFFIDISMEGIHWFYQSLLPTKNLVTNRVFEFPAKFPAHNRQYMRNFFVRVNQVDSYTGMIKYNCSSCQVLARRVGEQVELFCDFLGSLPEIHELTLQYRGPAIDSQDAFSGLEMKPFWKLETLLKITETTCSYRYY